MEEKINIAEILKNKPKCTRLYSPIFGECAFSLVREETDDICVKKHNGEKAFFDSKGLYNALGECLLFPSREMRDWHKFTWKKGDVLQKNSRTHVIFDSFVSDTYEVIRCKYFLKVDNGKEIFVTETNVFTNEYFKASEEQRQCYINKIEEHFGGKLNLETLEIEKSQPEFKDGDIVMSDSGTIVLVRGISLTRKIYYHAYMRNEYIYINQVEGEFFSRISRIKRFATDSEKQQLFDALAKKGKTWDSEKKAIVDLKPKVELKPFDKVLSRRCSEDYWVLNFYSHKTDYYHICIDGSSNLYCIPYNEETAHLLGTTDEWKGGEG